MTLLTVCRPLQRSSNEELESSEADGLIPMFDGGFRDEAGATEDRRKKARVRRVSSGAGSGVEHSIECLLSSCDKGQRDQYSTTTMV